MNNFIFNKQFNQKLAVQYFDFFIGLCNCNYNVIVFIVYVFTIIYPSKRHQSECKSVKK